MKVKKKSTVKCLPPTLMKPTHHGDRQVNYKPATASPVKEFLSLTLTVSL